MISVLIVSSLLSAIQVASVVVRRSFLFDALPLDGDLSWFLALPSDELPFSQPSIPFTSISILVVLYHL